MSGFRHVSDTTAHQGYVWNVVVAEFEAPDGQRFTRDLVRSPGAVAVVPITIGEGLPAVTLIKQYRPAFDRDIIEIPAGMRDIPGEPAIETGRRELIEEAGLAAGELVHLIDILPSVGMTDSITSIFLATECAEVSHDRRGPEEEAMSLMRMPLRDAIAMIDHGAITDSKTVVGLLMAERHLAGP
jgi:8-oxo-dGTP pyrophosphatase MutT (NUDIX family)